MPLKNKKVTNERSGSRPPSMRRASVPIRGIVRAMTDNEVRQFIQARDRLLTDIVRRHLR